MTHSRQRSNALVLCLAVAVVALQAAILSHASSHREAPMAAQDATSDLTDVYIFRSPENPNNVVMIMGVWPFSDPIGAPTYTTFNHDYVYRFNIDNDADAVADIVLEFEFTPTINPFTIEVDSGRHVELPFVVTQPITQPGQGAAVLEHYELFVTKGGVRTQVDNLSLGGTTFPRPVDNYGPQTFPNYPAYADQHIFDLGLPGAAAPGRVFVGQRESPFYADLGHIFDGLQLNGGHDNFAQTNFVALCIEVPIVFLDPPANNVIGVWSTVHAPQATVRNPFPQLTVDDFGTTLSGGPLVQVGRLGNPLVNELIIGMSGQSRFNTAAPADDVQFHPYFEDSALAELLNLEFPGLNASSSARTDLMQIYLGPTGAGEMLRIDLGVPVTPFATANPLGPLGAPPDPAGFPNGRRPLDDVVDITLRLVGGELAGNANAAGLSDGVDRSPATYPAQFPFLLPPSTAGLGP